METSFFLFEINLHLNKKTGTMNTKKRIQGYDGIRNEATG